MAANTSIIEAFAQHYRSGKFTDVHLVAKDGTTYGVHKLLLSFHSTVLCEQASGGAKIIEMDGDATIIKQMVEWMYGIDDKNLLVEGKSVDEVAAMGSEMVYGEITTLSDLANVAEKVSTSFAILQITRQITDGLQYQLLKLKDQATELVSQLAKKLTSVPHILEAVLQVPEGALGSTQRTLISRALLLVQVQQTDLEPSERESTKGPMPTPLPSHGDASEDREDEPAININRSALRSARTTLPSAQKGDEDSDTPLSKKRKQQHHDYSNPYIADHNRMTQQPPNMSSSEFYRPPFPPLARQPDGSSWGDFPPQSFPSDQHGQRLGDNLPRQSIPWYGQCISDNMQPPQQSQSRRDAQGLDTWRNAGRILQERAKQMDESWERAEKDGPLPSTVHPSKDTSAPTHSQNTQQTNPRNNPKAKPTKTKTPQTRRNEPFRISTALPENNPPKGPHCHCKAAESDETLLPCADCGKKFHPRCIGKGRYAKGTYYGNPEGYMKKDLEIFEDKPFNCGDCEAGFLGVR